MFTVTWKNVIILLKGGVYYEGIDQNERVNQNCDQIKVFVQNAINYNGGL